MRIKSLTMASLMLLLACTTSYGQKTKIKTKTYKVKNVSFTMVNVEGGDTVIVGTSEQGGSRGCSSLAGVTLYNTPVQVTLNNFWIGQTEVTQELWEAVMGDNPSENKDNPKQPVTNVSWDDCMVFVTRLSGLTGERFRMPTEAEWEYAARGGIYSEYYKYSGSNDEDEVGWKGTTYVVATKKPNELGIYDMTGEVKEWCKNGCTDCDILRGGDNPQGRSRTGYNSMRGHSYAGVSYRNAAKPDTRFRGIGFRVARSVKKTVVYED